MANNFYTSEIALLSMKSEVWDSFQKKLGYKVLGMFLVVSKLTLKSVVKFSKAKIFTKCWWDFVSSFSLVSNLTLKLFWKFQKPRFLPSIDEMMCLLFLCCIKKFPGISFRIPKAKFLPTIDEVSRLSRSTWSAS